MSKGNIGDTAYASCAFTGACELVENEHFATPPGMNLREGVLLGFFCPVRHVYCPINCLNQS